MRRLLPLSFAALLAGCTAQAPGGPQPVTSVSPPPLTGAWRASIDVKSGAFTDGQGPRVHVRVPHRPHAHRVVEPRRGAAGAAGLRRLAIRPGQRDGLRGQVRVLHDRAVTPEEFKAGAGWLPSGRGVFTERITVAPDGRTFTSTIRYELFDPMGAAIEGAGEATGRGVRIDF